MPRIDKADIEELAESSMPWVGMLGFTVESLGRGACRVRLPQNDEFLRPGGAMIAECLLKLGKRLAYGEATLFAEGDEGGGPVAHVTATYSIPPGAASGEQP